MNVSQTRIFKKQKKKLFPKQINELDKAIKKIIANPDLGNFKKGDLQGVKVYKFRMINQEYLIAYTTSKKHIFLINMGTHENFYRDLKKAL